MGFFYKGRVVNLDGAINSAAVTAIYRRSLGTYIQQEEVFYLADFSESLQLEHPVWGWVPPRLEIAYEHQQHYVGRKVRYIIYRLKE